jgi:peptidoglycan/LPS O-acetylase OafA/YrhL
MSHATHTRTRTGTTPLQQVRRFTVHYLEMVVAMTGWMGFRGHPVRPIMEMSAAMYVPFLLLLVPLWHGQINEHTFVLGAHVLMLLGMLLAMLVRLEEYVGHHGSPRSVSPESSSREGSLEG